MNAFKARRMQLGFTLRDVEQITGGQVSNAYLSQLENGKIKSPSLRIVCALAAVYSVSVETLQEWLHFPAMDAPEMCPTCGQFLKRSPRQPATRSAASGGDG